MQKAKAAMKGVKTPVEPVDETEEVEDQDTETVAAADEQPEVPMKDQVREAWKNGESRAAIAKRYGVTYQRVFALTKGIEGGPGGTEAGGRARVMVVASEKLTEAGHEDLVGKPRAEAIRELFEDGMKLGDIARLLDTSYQVAFQATKSIRAGNEPDDESEDAEDVEDTEEVEDSEEVASDDEEFDLTDDETAEDDDDDEPEE